MNSPRFFPLVVSTLAPMVMAVSTANAQHTTWRGGDAAWSNAANWSHGLPNSGAAVYHDNGGTIFVNSDYMYSAVAFIGFQSSGSGTIAASAGRWQSGNLYVGYNGGGMLLVNGGHVSSTFGVIGENAASHGEAVVTSGSWTQTRALKVGNAGTGSLTVNGGVVSTAEGLDVGYAASGTMVLTSGTVRVGTSSYIGQTATGSGQVEVSGGTWTTSQGLVVGQNGAGRLEISGGTVSASWTTIGRDPTGSGTLILSGNEGGRGVLATSSIYKRDGSATISWDGGILRATDTSSDFISGFSTGDITVGSKGAYIDSNGRAITINAPLGGTGPLHKIGAGFLALSSENSYAGGTVVEGGTLAASHAKALGSGNVTVEGGALQIDQGMTIANPIALEGGRLIRGVAGGSTFAGALSVSTTLGAATHAELIGGTSTWNSTLDARFAATSGATNDGLRISGVFHLSGVGFNYSANEPDRFVLQLAVASLSPEHYLAWFNPTTNQWVNAVEANDRGGQFFAGDRAYEAADLANLGTYGVDTANGTVWAVLNRNGAYAVVPEPGAWALLGLGAAAFLYRVRRRNV